MKWCIWHTFWLSLKTKINIGSLIVPSNNAQNICDNKLKDKKKYKACYTNIIQFIWIVLTRKTNKHSLVYPNLVFVIRPVLHNKELPVPVFGVLLQSTVPITKKDSLPENDTRDKDFSVEALLQLFSQVKLNDLACNLKLSKSSAELSASNWKKSIS